MKNVLVCDSELRAKEGRNTIYKTYWNPRRRRRPGQSRGVRSVTACNFSQIWRTRSRRQFLLRVAVLHFREARARVLTFLSILLWLPASVGIQLASAGTVGSLCFNESKFRDSEKSTNLALTSNAFPGRRSRESVQGLVKTCLDMRAADSDRGLLASSLQRTFNAAWSEYRSGCTTSNRLESVQQ